MRRIAIVMFAILVATPWIDASPASEIIKVQSRNSLCTNPENPRYCRTAHWCCPNDKANTCVGYRGYNPSYTRYGGNVFCVRPVDEADRADLRKYCQQFARC